MIPRFSPILRGPSAAAGGGGGGIAFVNAGAIGSKSGGTSLTLTLPGSRVNGNLLLALIACTNVFNMAATGWTAVNANSGSDVAMFYRYVDGTEASTINFTWSGTMSADGYIIQLTGTKATSPIGNRNTNVTTSSATAVGNSLTTGTNGSIVLAIVIATGKSITSVSGTGWTDDADHTAVGVTYGFGTGSKVVATAGASGAMSAALSGSCTARTSLYEILAP